MYGGLVFAGEALLVRCIKTIIEPVGHHIYLSSKGFSHCGWSK
jgi:hypothetical protein